MPGGHFISQPIPYCFLWSCSRLHSILSSFEGYVSTICLRSSVQKISHVEVASRAFSISLNSPLFSMILGSFPHYIVVVWRSRRDLRLSIFFPKDISLWFHQTLICPFLCIKSFCIVININRELNYVVYNNFHAIHILESTRVDCELTSRDSTSCGSTRHQLGSTSARNWLRVGVAATLHPTELDQSIRLLCRYTSWGKGFYLT